MFTVSGACTVEEPKMFKISEVTLKSQQEPECEILIHVHTDLWKKSVGANREVLVSVLFEGLCGDKKKCQAPMEESMYACHGKVYSTKSGRGISFGGLMCTMRSPRGEKSAVLGKMCPLDMMGRNVTMQFRPNGAGFSATKRKRRVT